MVLLLSLSYTNHYEWLLKGYELQTKKNSVDIYQMVVVEILQSLERFLGIIRKLSFNSVIGTALSWVAIGNVA